VVAVVEKICLYIYITKATPYFEELLNKIDESAVSS
jgi:hypothetical protein